MTCRHYQELLSPYLDGVLSHEDTQNVLAHLAQCVNCSKYLSQVEQNRQLIRALPEAEVTEAMTTRLQSTVRSSPRRRGQAEFRVRRQKFAAPNMQHATLQTWWRDWPMLSFGTVATCAASLLFYFVMMQAPPKVSAEEVVASMDQLINTLDPDEGEHVITEETPDEVMSDWSDEIDGELFEDENEQD